MPMLEELVAATIAARAVIDPTKAQARTFQGFQLRPVSADVLVIDEASMLSVPQMLD